MNVSITNVKKTILAELVSFLVTFTISLIIFTLLFDFSSLPDNTVDIALHDTYFIFGSIIILGQFWLILYFLTNSIRQIFLKFNNLLANVMLILVTGLLSYSVYGYINLLTDPGVVFVENSITLYPPLSGIPETIENDNFGLKRIINFLWTIEIVLLSILILTIIMTIYRRKKR